MNPRHSTVSKKTKTKSIVLVLIWVSFIFLNTWAQDLSDLFSLRAITFKWVPSPDLMSFFHFHDLTQIHQFFAIVKLGHFFSFALMHLFLFRVFKKNYLSLAISLVLAFLTEFLQLYFARDGRLYDFVIDSLGIFSMYFLLKKRPRKM